MDATTWVPSAVVGLVVSVGGYLISWRVTTAKQEGAAPVQEALQMERGGTLREDLRLLRDDLRAAVTEIRALGTATAERTGAQDVINRVTADTLKSMSRKWDEHETEHRRIEATIAEHAASLSLISQLMERKATTEGKSGSL